MDVDQAQRHDYFYDDLNADDAARISAGLKLHSFASFRSPLKHEPYSDMPVTYVRCSKDNAIPPFVQDMLIEAAGRREKISIVDVEADHRTVISMPKVCADIIVHAAESANTAV